MPSLKASWLRKRRHRAHSDCAHNGSVTLKIVKCEKKSKYKDAKRMLKSAIWPRRVPAKETLGNIISVINVSI